MNYLKKKRDAILFSMSAKSKIKNLWQFEDPFVCSTSQNLNLDNKTGGFNFYDLDFSNPITLSAIVTRYPEDTALEPRIALRLYYTDGSYTQKLGNYGQIPADGVPVQCVCSVTPDSAKTPDYLRAYVSSYSSLPGAREIKAENIMLLYGTYTAENLPPYSRYGD